MKTKPCKCAEYGPTVLRVVIGLFFVIAGFSKLTNPAMIIGMIGKMGIPASGLVGWLVILGELIFGGLVLIGWRLKQSVWPLIIILAVATLFMVIPSFGTNAMATINLFFHLTTIAGLISLYLTGPGAYAAKS